MSDDHVDVTINDKTKMPLGWVVALIGFTGTLVLWASSVASTAAASLKEVESVNKDVTNLKHDIEIIREAQIRIETQMGLSPSYSKMLKSKKGE